MLYAPQEITNAEPVLPLVRIMANSLQVQWDQDQDITVFGKPSSNHQKHMMKMLSCTQAEML